MRLEDKEDNLAEIDRDEVIERVKTNGLSGQKLIVVFIAVVASLMLFYGVAKNQNFFGLGEKPKKAQQVVEEAGPKAPEITIPEPIIEQPVAQLIDEATVCEGGLRLPKGMPCPEARTGTSAPAGDGKPKVNEVLQRKLRGTVSVASTVPAVSPDALMPVNSVQAESAQISRAETLGNGLTDSIPVTFTPRAQASKILNPSLTMAKGQMPDCNLAVAIKTSQPGFILCKTSMPVYSLDGKVVLLESGTVMEGEYRANIQGGQTSVQAIFTRARTPNNIIIPLDSPATDALGRSGIPGEVDHKWIQRFGGAILSAIIEDSIDVYKSSQNQGGGNNNVISAYPNTNSSGKAITDELLKQGSLARPDLNVPQGQIIKIFVARDIDFSSVYKLQSTEGQI